MSASLPFDSLLLSRVEDASLNASAPREQRWMDGWLVRTCPGKAKRARSVQPVAAGRQSVAEKMAACRQVYETAGLPLFVRITPFSQPAGLDEVLAAAGMARLDDTRVMVRRAPPAGGAGHVTLPSPQVRFETADLVRFAEWLGEARDSPASERSAHARRLAQAPIPVHATFAVDQDGKVVAAGHVAIEGDIAGLYDIMTHASQRRRGIGALMCMHLLDQALAHGAGTAYLQVDAANSTARRLYERLGFVDGYAYHYRSPA